MKFNQQQWAVILGGSSGFGLASAKKLAELGMSVCIVHRDRRGAMSRINQHFDEIKAMGNPFVSFNVDALSEQGVADVIEGLKQTIGDGQIKTLLHSIAFGNLKPIAPVKPAQQADNALNLIADKLNLDVEQLKSTVNETLGEQGGDSLFSLVNPQYSDALIEEEDLNRTIFSMGTSMLTWTQALFQQGLFADDARVIGLTSEGNQIAWRGYAAVSAAKVALESISRSIAVEFAPHGIRSNIIQAGVTDTPALNAIPGSNRMKAVATLKNPFKRLTTPEDVADVVALLSLPEAQWINGALIHADGGEHIAAL